MSVYGTLEVLCLFETLRNVDLLEQGLYCIRARLCSDKENYGVPLVNFNAASPTRKARNPRHLVFAPYITTNTNAYCTRSFWVQYVEELIELNEVVLFRIDLSTSDFENLNVTLELELLFSDNDSIAFPQLMQPVSQQKYKLSVTKGLHQFYPVSFDEWHFCIVRSAFHSCLVEFTYKPPTKSFLRFPFSTCTPRLLATEDATDMALFGIPCRTIMRNAFQRLGKKFQQTATRLSTKQQISYAPLLKPPTLLERKDRRSSTRLSNPIVFATEAMKEADWPNISLPAHPVRGPLPQDPSVAEVMAELRCIGEQIFELWQRYLVIFALVGKEDSFRLSQIYDKKCVEVWKESFFREKAHISTIEEMFAIRSNPHKQMAETVRSSTYYKKLKPWPITAICTKPELSVQPIVFEQIICLRTSDDEGATEEAKSEAPSIDHESTAMSRIIGCSSVKACKEYEGVHLFVLLHGLLGNGWDMRMLRNQIASFMPDSEFLICTSIEQMTLTDLEDMGVAVANEIATHIGTLGLNIGRLSFVGHSLGGLVLRVALRSEVLRPYLCKLYTFLSLSVPHTGTIAQNNQLIPSAMWLWQKWTNSACLKQMRLMDHPDPYQTFIYKLSLEKGLEYFQNILLVSSEQDSYVPYHSARIELRKDAPADTSKQGVVLFAMVQNLWQPILNKLAARDDLKDDDHEYICPFSGLTNGNTCAPKCTEPTIAVRYDVTFASHRGVDGVIGRAAHIRLLDSAKLMQMFISNNKQYFT